MSETGSIDLTFIARQLQQLTASHASLRDDMNVLMAMMQRLDGTMSGLVNEVRAMHSRHARVERRVSQLEEWRDTPSPTP